MLHILAESPGQCFHVLVSYLDTFSNVDTFWDNTQIYGGLKKIIFDEVSELILFIITLSFTAV